METVLRDAHQSLFATRMKIEDMLPILHQLDEVGYFSLECWGGATFDVCMRFLGENPWERLRKIKEVVKKTRLQMLLRGQNLVGYRHYADDVVEKFVKLAKENGVDIFRIFDAVNDVRNMEYPIKVAKEVGGVVEGTISYTISPVHTVEIFVKLAKDLKDLGCDIICIKDMAGLISPPAAYNLVKELKDKVKLPVHLHSHCTSGMAPIAYYAAAEAGVDIVDCAISPFSFGTSQPATETIVGAFRETEFDTGLDLEKLIEIAQHFQKVREKYLNIIDPVSERIDPTLLLHQIPGGMISNLISQLKEQNAMDKYSEVLKEVARVRKDMGYPPLVTPTSQIVGTQAVFNVLLGERYKMISKEVQDYVKGMYGRPPGEILPEIKEKFLSCKEEEIICRPADLLSSEYEKAKEEIKDMSSQEEDVVSYVLFPSVFKKFFAPPSTPSIPLIPTPSSPKYDIDLEGSKYDVQIKNIQENKILLSINEEEYSLMLREIGDRVEIDINGEKIIVEIKDITPDKITASVQDKEVVLRYAESSLVVEEKNKDIPGKQESPKKEGGVLAPMHGKITKILVKKGQKVKKGKVLLILEAMKMENEIKSPKEGTVVDILVKEGAAISVGDTLLLIG